MELFNNSDKDYLLWVSSPYAMRQVAKNAEEKYKNNIYEIEKRSEFIRTFFMWKNYFKNKNKIWPN